VTISNGAPRRFRPRATETTAKVAYMINRIRLRVVLGRIEARCRDARKTRSQRSDREGRSKSFGEDSH